MMAFIKSFEDVRRLVYDIKQRENILLDYKSGDNPKDADGVDIAKDVSSFANQSGGYLVYGVRTDNDGYPTEINGVPDPEKLRDKIIKSAASVANINPPIFVDPVILEGEGKKVIVVGVDESIDAPHFYRGMTTFWIRGADHNNPIEATPDMLLLLQNRRAEMEKNRLAQLSINKNLALRWMVQNPVGETKDFQLIRVPYFSISLQPRIFNASLLDIRKIRKAIENTVRTLQQIYKWPTRYWYSFMEGKQESYALSCVYRDDWSGWRNGDQCVPNIIWSSLSATGLFYHFEDIPFKHKVPDGKGGETLCGGFDSIYMLRRVMAFLLFAKEYFSFLNVNFAFDLRIEFERTQGMVPLYHNRPLYDQRIIDGNFIIKRSLTTMELAQESIERLIFDDITPELLLNINFTPGHTFDGNEVNAVKRVLTGQ